MASGAMLLLMDSSPRLRIGFRQGALVVDEVSELLFDGISRGLSEDMVIVTCEKKHKRCKEVEGNVGGKSLSRVKTTVWSRRGVYRPLLTEATRAIVV
jgi:hypothetical protein